VAEETVVSQFVGGTLVLRVHNRKFDYEEGEQVVAAVYQQAPEGRVIAHVVLNLESVEQVRSAGLSVIGRLGLDFQLKVVCPSPEVKKVLNMMGFLPLLKLHYTEKEALADCR
jgi:anti-anti-sigma factor